LQGNYPELRQRNKGFRVAAVSIGVDLNLVLQPQDLGTLMLVNANIGEYRRLSPHLRYRFRGDEKYVHQGRIPSEGSVALRWPDGQQSEGISIIHMNRRE